MSMYDDRGDFSSERSTRPTKRQREWNDQERTNTYHWPVWETVGWVMFGLIAITILKSC